MTDNEIIKALECCSTYAYHYCSECGFKDGDLLEAALDLINRQKAEIEALDFLIKESNKLVERQDKAIDRLQADNSSMQSTLAKMSMGVAEAKAEAIKEFAERLKSYLHQDDFETPDERWKPESEFAILIELLVKEMVGDAE